MLAEAIISVLPEGRKLIVSTILSIDDSAMMRKVIRGAVEVVGYDFAEASNGEEGLTYLNDNADDIVLILLDVNMPGIGGFEVLQKIQADEKLSAIPVIMVTTESEKSHIVDAIKSGASNYVCKPFTQEELTTKMIDSLSTGMEF
jgi:two-component system chemotaxis response regulator CheY